MLKADQELAYLPLRKCTSRNQEDTARETRSRASDPIIIIAMTSFNQCYDSLHKNIVFHHDSMKLHCTRFSLQYAAANSTETKKRFWTITSKLHLFQEMCIFSSARPALTWTYRDEDFGGIMAALSRRRGGRNTALGVSRTTLQRFRAQAACVRVS